MPMCPGVADAHRRAVGADEAAGQMRGTDGLVGAHRDHQRAGEAPRGPALDRRAVHGHVDVLLDVADRQAGVQQRTVERERAAEQERDEVLAPVRRRVAGLVDELAVAVDA